MTRTTPNDFMCVCLFVSLNDYRLSAYCTAICNLVCYSLQLRLLSRQCKKIEILSATFVVITSTDFNSYRERNGELINATGYPIIRTSVCQSKIRINSGPPCHMWHPQNGA